MCATKYISFNIKGINNAVKRKKLLTWLKKEKASIVLLQETHLDDKEHEKLKREWVGQVYYSSFSTSKRGVAILINKSTPFTLEKCVKDNQGRYVLITGLLHGERVLIGCVYAPNMYQEHFSSKLLADTSAVSQTFSILGGDFNCTMDPEVDQTLPARSVLSKMRETTKKLCSDLQLLDAWRIVNPKEKDYTFFSNPHHSYSRIDYFFITRTVLDRVESCKIGTRLLSDHADVSIVVSPPSPQFISRQWRLNPSLLKQPSFVNFLKEQIKDFLSNNDNEYTNPSILWDTLKAYLRGVIISYSTARKKEALKEQLRLESQLTKFETQMKLNPSAELSKKVEVSRSALNQLLTQRAEASMLYAKHRLFEMGDKPGRLLARLAAGRHEVRAISTLQDNAGKNHYESKMLVEVMKTFYEKLYASELKASTQQIENFLNTLKLPTLTDSDRIFLGSPITKEEIISAIKCMPSGKAPGPDGYCPEFYKTFQDSLNLPLLNMYMHSVEKGSLPSSLYSANISLILKKDKPADKCSSYRPM